MKRVAQRSPAIKGRRKKRGTFIRGALKKIKAAKTKDTLDLAPGDDDTPRPFVPYEPDAKVSETPPELESLLLKLPPGATIEDLGVTERPKDLSVRDWLHIPENLDCLLEYVAQGVAQPALAQVLGVSTFQLAAALRSDWKKYEAALAGLAHVQVSQVQADLENVRSGLLDPESARVLLSGNQWLLARHDKRVYGDTTRHEVATPDGESIKVSVDHEAADKVVATLLPPLLTTEK